MANKYVPGVCNIGPAEIARRKQIGFICLVATIALWALFLWIGLPRVWLLVLFIPAMMSASGFLQAYMHFCAGFGSSALYNFGEVGKTNSVKNAKFRALDRQKAWQIIIYSIIIGVIVAIIAYFIRV